MEIFNFKYIHDLIFLQLFIVTVLFKIKITPSLNPYAKDLKIIFFKTV